jgi:hypothetical protein
LGLTARLITKLEDRLESLNDELLNRENKIIHLTQENKSLDRENQYLKEQLDWFKRQIFGQRSERIVSDLNSQQLEFDGFENIARPHEEERKKQSLHTLDASRIGTDRIRLHFLQTCL